MADIAVSSILSSSVQSKPEVVAPVPVQSAVAPTEFFVSPYTLIDTTTSKAILVLRDTSTGDIQVQVPAQVNIDSAIAAESSQQAQRRAAFVDAFAGDGIPEAAQQQVIEPSVVVVAQQIEQQSSDARQQAVPVPEAVTAALSLGAQLSQQPAIPQVSFSA